MGGLGVGETWQDARELRRVLRNSSRLLVITGAGCSTPSGIGDYRDDAGAWKRPQPVQHHDFVSSLQWRQRYWARSQFGYPEFMRARPNPAHRILADWERRGRVSGLITQNVDRLHQRAGQQRVIDLHGRLDQVVCLDCGAVLARSDVQTFLDAQNPAPETTLFTAAPDGDAELARTDFSAFRVPPCPACAGVLKPNVVFYGGQVDTSVVQQAFEWVDEADALLVVGSSLMVYSSFRFVKRAHARGIPIAAINRGRTRADALLRAKVARDCVEVLSELETHLAQ